jgi:hypothetical protein
VVDVGNVVELHEDFNIANRVVSQFGLVSEIQRPKVRHPKSETEFQLTNRLKPIFPGTISPKPFRTR